MDRLGLRTMVRDLARMEPHDVTDEQLDTYLDEGYLEVLANRTWPWAYALAPETVSMVAGTNEYTLTDDVKRVLAVIEKEQRYPLTQVSQNDWARRQDSIQSTSRPIWYVFTNKTLSVWPVPATTDDLDVYYYEHPVFGPDDTDLPPFDAAYHTALTNWALSRLWEMEEDFDKADSFRARFEVKLIRMEQFYNTEMQDRPLIYGGGASHHARPTSMPWLGDARVGGATG